MSSQSERLRISRESAGYRSAEQAARALGIPASTYHSHENGEKGLSRAGERYARFYNVEVEWLLYGRGPMRRKSRGQLPVTGHVGAGALIVPIDDAAGDNIPHHVEWPDPENLAVEIVYGDSQYPRYMHGEAIVYSRRARQPRELINSEAVVQCTNGDRLLKIVRKGTHEGVWTLESHNAPPMHDVMINAVYEIIGRLK